MPMAPSFLPTVWFWNAPIDSGQPFSAQFVFQPLEVGTFQLSITRRLKSQWQPLTSLVLAISEDGKTMYAGSSADYRLNIIPPHPQRNFRPLTVRFPLRGPPLIHCSIATLLVNFDSPGLLQ